MNGVAAGAFQPNLALAAYLPLLSYQNVVLAEEIPVYWISVLMADSAPGSSCSDGRPRTLSMNPEVLEVGYC